MLCGYYLENLETFRDAIQCGRVQILNKDCNSKSRTWRQTASPLKPVQWQPVKIKQEPAAGVPQIDEFHQFVYVNSDFFAPAALMSLKMYGNVMFFLNGLDFAKFPLDG